MAELKHSRRRTVNEASHRKRTNKHGQISPKFSKDFDQPPMKVTESKRRQQNVLAAKKSYEAKKKERSSLLKRNDELIQEQKDLLHERARLESEVTYWKEILDIMDHRCQDECETRVSSYCTSTLKEVIAEDEGSEVRALDLSIKAAAACNVSVFTIQQPASFNSTIQKPSNCNSTIQQPASFNSTIQQPAKNFQGNTCTLDSVVMEYLVEDGSTLDLGATQEVELRIRRGRKPKRVTFADKPVQFKKSDVFIPKIYAV